MCEFLERMRLTGTPTEEVRKWSGMTHRVVELTGPFPTPDEMRVELWLHEESATKLLDMCDWIDAEFHKVQAENAKLRELVRDLERARSALCDEYPDRLCVDCDECPANVVCDTDPVGRVRELGIEVDG